MMGTIYVDFKLPERFKGVECRLKASHLYQLCSTIYQLEIFAKYLIWWGCTTKHEEVEEAAEDMRLLVGGLKSIIGENEDLTEEARQKIAELAKRAFEHTNDIMRRAAKKACNE